MPGDHIQNLQMQSLRTDFPRGREPACGNPSGLERVTSLSHKRLLPSDEVGIAPSGEIAGSLPPAPDQATVEKGAQRRPWL